ncbi:MAG TPA: Hsp20/alpha crystallin family protein [Gemmatimonadaceae bacterium]
MAEQQKADTPPTEGQGQQSRGGKASSRGGSGATNTDNVQSAGSSSGSGQSAQQSSDQERQRQISREPSSSSGAGMQRGGQSGAGAALSGRGQQSMLPAFMTNPGLMASAFMSDPFAFAQAMSQEMDRLFDTFGGTSEGGRALSTSGSSRRLQQQGGRGQSYWAPQMEVFQRGHEMVVRADLPGISPDDVQIDVEDGVLTISGERRNTNEDRQEGFYRSERSYGTFARSIALPEGVDEDQVNARYEHGVLEVMVPMPQQQRQRGRRVQIQSGTGSGSSQHAGQSSGQQSSSRQSAGQQGSEHRSGEQSGAGGASSTSR